MGMGTPGYNDPSTLDSMGGLTMDDYCQDVGLMVKHWVERHVKEGETPRRVYLLARSFGEQWMLGAVEALLGDPSISSRVRLQGMGLISGVTGTAGEFLNPETLRLIGPRIVAKTFWQWRTGRGATQLSIDEQNRIFMNGIGNGEEQEWYYKRTHAGPSGAFQELAWATALKDHSRLGETLRRFPEFRDLHRVRVEANNDFTLPSTRLTKHDLHLSALGMPAERNHRVPGFHAPSPVVQRTEEYQRLMASALRDVFKS